MNALNTYETNNAWNIRRLVNQWVCPSNPASQCIVLKIVGFLGRLQTYLWSLLSTKINNQTNNCFHIIDRLWRLWRRELLKIIIEYPYWTFLKLDFFVRQKFGILVSTGRPEKVSQFPFDECIKKARVFPLSQRFQTRDRRKLTYSKELIIGAPPPAASLFLAQCL